MKLPRLFLVAGMILCMASGIEAQDLQISLGNKSKTFKIGTLIKVDIPPREGVSCNPCKNNYLIGRIISYQNDILTLRVFYEREPITEAQKEIGSQIRNYKFKNEQAWPVTEIPKSNIYSITKQGKKTWKPMNDGDLMGTSFISVGVIFLMTALLAEGENDSDALLGTGITMTGIGVIMITSFNRQTLNTENNPNNSVKDKVWIIR